MWGYDDGSGRGVRSPGYTIEVQKGTATNVTYVNGLPNQHMFSSTVPDYMHAGSPVRMNTHLHGGHVAGSSDGNPYADAAEFVPRQSQTVVGEVPAARARRGARPAQPPRGRRAGGLGPSERRRAAGGVARRPAELAVGTTIVLVAAVLVAQVPGQG